MKEKNNGENHHIFYANGRLFINSELGCLANCSYCYLDEIGLNKGVVSNIRDSRSIILELEKNVNSLWSPDATLVSFGCYSDPWSISSRQSTADIIKYLDKKEYKITLSTKQYISTDSLKEIASITNKDNLIFLVSIPVIMEKENHEKGTSSIRLRVKSIDNITQAGFNAAIYIKPFIPGVTILGLSTIKSIIKDFEIPVILGRSFSTDGTGKSVLITEKANYYENECSEYLHMKRSLEGVSPVYEHSYEIFSKS